MNSQLQNQVHGSNAGYNLNTLRDFFDGNEEVVIDILKLIVTEIPVFLEKIERETQEALWVEVYRSAHKFKPTTVSLGTPNLKQLILQIEEKAKSQVSTEEIPGLVLELKTNLLSVKNQLEQDFPL